MPTAPLTDAEIVRLREIIETYDAAEEMGAELVESEGFIEEARKVAREEIRSVAGLGLRRSQDRNYSRSPDRNAAIDIVHDEAAAFWGEVLNDFSTEVEPGA